MNAFMDDLADLFPDTISAQPGTIDRMGKFTPVGSAVPYRAQCTGDVRMVRNSSNQEKVSSVKAIMAGQYGLTDDRHRYSIPSRFVPNAGLVAVAVEHHTDEDGACYEIIRFP